MQFVNKIVALKCTNILGIRITAAFIHHTPPCHAKKKDKWKYDNPTRSEAAKEYTKYLRRKERSEIKKILKGLSEKPSSKNRSRNYRLNRDSFIYRDRDGGSDERSSRNFNKQTKVNSQTKKKSRNRSNHYSYNANSSHASEQAYPKTKRKSKSQYSFWDEDSDEDEDTDGDEFEKVVKSRLFYWSYSDVNERKNYGSQQSYSRVKSDEYESDEYESDDYESGDFESDDEVCSIGCASDRVILGLPPNGPLTLQEVKVAFRTSALKWHPDRNEGAGKVLAEEKFKRCGAAYQSLCDAFSGK